MRRFCQIVAGCALLGACIAGPEFIRVDSLIPAPYQGQGRELEFPIEIDPSVEGRPCR